MGANAISTTYSALSAGPAELTDVLNFIFLLQTKDILYFDEREGGHRGYYL